ncbi:citrate lyase holo-[acyl-carrier protein] synthase [Treponema primitia]|uniref:citrate lyase holo-[acyl-carrier protein] synthase n=1 Tax=Treponema primitia TaxID=88058 RepID=UPI00398130BB
MDLLELYAGSIAELPELLDSRESRVLRQQELLRHAPAVSCLISFTLNIPGPVKRFPLAEQAFAEGLGQIRRILKAGGVEIIQSEEKREKTGCEALLLISSVSAGIKDLMRELEDSHPLGRLFDADVLDREGKKLSRREGKERACLICGGPAGICARSRAHGLDEIRREAARILRDYFTNAFEDALVYRMQRALLTEAAVTPKPGLVDRFNNGAHKDMDIFSFQASAAVLGPYLRRFIRAGILHGERPPGELFPLLRPIGIAAEEAMLAATGGVNTHRGIIFSMGIGGAALGIQHGLARKTELRELSRLCGEIARPVLKDFERIKGAAQLSHGERLYAVKGITGIRGEAAAGFPLVFNCAIPVLRRGLEKGMSLNDAAVITLLHLITRVEDTNCITRSSPETFKHTQEEILEALPRIEETGDMEAVFEIDKRFIAGNLSPGGCADLLALALFFNSLRDVHPLKL